MNWGMQKINEPGAKDSSGSNQVMKKKTAAGKTKIDGGYSKALITTKVAIMETAIREMTRRIIAQFNPIKIVLFGSHARGDRCP